MHSEVVRRVITDNYKLEEKPLADYIRSEARQGTLTDDYVKHAANNLMGSLFTEHTPTADFSKFNRWFTEPLGPYYPNRETMYQQVKAVCESNRQVLLTLSGNPICDEQIHKIAEYISLQKPWKISFKSMLFLEAYKLWYSAYNHKFSVTVYCAAKPDIPSHWVHQESVETSGL